MQAWTDLFLISLYNMHASEIKVQADGMPAKGAGIRGETAQVNN